MPGIARVSSSALAVAAALWLLLASACGGSGGITAPEGWEIHRTETYRIALPPGWRAAAAEDELPGLLASLRESYPGYEGLWAQIERQASAFDLIAFDMADADAGLDFITNLNSSTFPAAPGTPLRDVVERDLENLKSAMEAEILGVEERPIAGVPAIRASLRTRAVGFDLLQLLWAFRPAGSERVYAVWFTTEWERRADKEPVFDRIAESFRLRD